MEGLGFTDVAPFKSLGLVFEDGHGREHAPEAEPSIEGLFARDRVQDDLLVPVRELDQFGDDLLADARSLVSWEYRYIADVRTVRPVRKCSPGADDSLAIMISFANCRACSCWINSATAGSTLARLPRTRKSVTGSISSFYIKSMRC